VKKRLVTLRLDEETIARADERAHRAGISRTALIRDLIWADPPKTKVTEGFKGVIGRK